MTATVFYDNVNEIALLANTFQAGSPLIPALVIQLDWHRGGL